MHVALCLRQLKGFSHVPVTVGLYTGNNLGDSHETSLDMPDDYFAYLLRLRRVDNAGHTQWVITLQEPASNREYRFTDLIALVHFLHETMGNTQSPTISDRRHPTPPPNL
jgi:hypothetical protein